MPGADVQFALKEIRVFAHLDLNLRPVRDLDLSRFDLIAVVDTQPATGNNSLPEGAKVDIVIDHHPVRTLTRACPFTDVRRKYGATSTILFEYLRNLGIEPSPPLATALCYGIRSDTQDLGRETTKADIQAFISLYPLVNVRMLARIQSEPQPIEYFQVLAEGLRNAAVYGKCIVSFLGEVPGPELVAEVADLLLRYDAVTWALCGGLQNGVLHLSLRTREAEADADKVMRRLVSRLGSGGGHLNMAGGQVPVGEDSAAQRKEKQEKVLRRLLRRIHGTKLEGAPLLSKR